MHGQAQAPHGSDPSAEEAKDLGGRQTNVALDRDATDRGIALARTFGARGRDLVPPDELGPKDHLNDWLRVRAKGDLAAFRSVLEQALVTSPTPWALQIHRLLLDLASWDNAAGNETACEDGLHLYSLPSRNPSVPNGCISRLRQEFSRIW